MNFKYGVGQAVEYVPIGGSIGLYAIVRHMPKEDAAADHTYRIKNVSEGFERIVLECDLAPANRSASDYSVTPSRPSGLR